MEVEMIWRTAPSVNVVLHEISALLKSNLRAVCYFSTIRISAAPHYQSGCPHQTGSLHSGHFARWLFPHPAMNPGRRPRRCLNLPPLKSGPEVPERCTFAVGQQIRQNKLSSYIEKVGTFSLCKKMPLNHWWYNKSVSKFRVNNLFCTAKNSGWTGECLIYLAFISSLEKDCWDSRHFWKTNEWIHTAALRDADGHTEGPLSNPSMSWESICGKKHI